MTTTTMFEFADRLRMVADHFQNSPYAHPSVILTEIQYACGAYGIVADPHDYAHKLELVYQALADEAGCHRDRLDITLRTLNLRTELPDTIRRAATRIEEEA